MGLGGGFLMTIYDAKTGKAEFVNARETAPHDADENMFKGNASLAIKGTTISFTSTFFFYI